MNLIDNITGSSNYVEKFLLSAKQMNLTNKKEWLGRLLDSDRFLYRDSFEGDAHTIRSAEKKLIIKTQIFELIDLFNRKYGKDWDIQLEPKFIGGKTRFEIFFVIRYGNIIISNSQNRNRNLKDLLVILPLSYSSSFDCIYFIGIFGTRFTFSHDEWYSGYMHSHLSSIPRINSFYSVGNVKEFCLGSSELSELKMELSTVFDIAQIELMLYTIDSYVIWESLEGGPHITMNKITLQNSESRMNDISDSNCDTLYGYLIDSLNRVERNHLPFNFIYTEGRYKLKNLNELNDFIKDKFINTDLSEYNEHILCKRGNDGHYYKIPNNIRNIQTPKEAINNIKQNNNNELPFIYIQGEKIEFSIINIQEESIIDLNEYIVYPKFLKYVSQQFECKIYNSCIRGSAINYIYNSSSYVRRDSE